MATNMITEVFNLLKREHKAQRESFENRIKVLALMVDLAQVSDTEYEEEDWQTGEGYEAIE